MSILRQSAIVLSLAWLLAPLQFLTSIVVARLLGPEGKGVLAVLAGVTAVLSSVVILGVPSGAAALYRRPDVNRAEIVGTGVALVLLSSALTLAAFAAGGDRALALILGPRDIARLDPAWVTLAVAAAVPAALWAFGDVVLIAADAMRVYAWRSAVGGLLGLALTWVLALQLHWGITGVLVAQPSGQLAGFAIFAAWWARQPGLRPPRVGAAATRELLRVGVQQHALSMIALVSKRIDIFLIAALLTLEDAGYYAVAILLPTVIVGIPRATMWPLVTALTTDGGRDGERMAQASRLQVTGMLLATAMLLPLVPFAVHALFGPAFAPAVTPMRLALLGVVATPLTITVNAYLTARRRPGLSIVSALAGTGVQVAVTLALIGRWGVSAPAIAFTANHLVTAACQLAVLRAHDGMRLSDMLVPTRADLALLRSALRR